MTKSKQKEEQEIPVRNDVYTYLRNAILEEKLKPGDRVVERKIAEDLQVSRTPIREAIRKLEQEGLLNHSPQRGVVVTSLTTRDVWELYTIRAVLEGLAARLAAERISPEEMNQLEVYFSGMGKALGNNTNQLDELHGDFHRQIVKAAQSPRLEQMVKSMADHAIMFTRIGYGAPGRRREALDEHRALLNAIKNGHVEQAEQIARKHIERSCEAYFIQRALTDSK
jgi:DNA-binding GntR family transcriptional regulator